MSIGVYKEYRRTQVAVSSQRDLILMMYNAAIKNTREGKDAIKGGNLEEANNKLLKAQDIISELMNSLRLDAGEISNNLYSLYDYMISRLVQANIRKDVECIDHVDSLLTELKEAWEEAILPVETNASMHKEIVFRG
jgi:flagellar protein FliS